MTSDGDWGTLNVRYIRIPNIKLYIHVFVRFHLRSLSLPCIQKFKFLLSSQSHKL